NGTMLPAGLSLNANTGAITGTPTAPGQVNFTIKVELFNGNTTTGCAVTQNFSINITCASNPVVTTNADGGAGSLREAIALACPGSTISFQAGISIITLTSGELVVNKNLTIQGPGANLLTISGNNASRVFNINSGNTVSLSGMTITGGKAVDGGGISNAGSLTITACAISGNTANSGGGVNNRGGGIYSRGLLNLTNSTVSDNISTGGNSFDTGGGMYNDGSTATLTNCTISGNRVTSAASSASSGGGLHIQGGTVNLTNCTVIANSASGGTDAHGGGIRWNTGTINIRNTIIAGNSISGAFILIGPDVSGNVNSQGYNLIGNTGGTTITGDTTGNILNVNPQIGPLAHNGGPTKTHALLPGGPAINAGNNCVLTANACGDNNPALTTDQRGTGFPRKVGSAVDIGAFEANYSLAATGGTPQSTTVNTAFAQPLQATLTESGQPVSGVQLNFTAPSSGASANLGSATATTNSSGIASITATANLTPGSYQVTAGANGLTPAPFNLSNTCPAINATANGGGVICPTGVAQVFVNVSGGTAPYTVTLTNGGGQQTGAGPFTFNVSPAGTTTYSVQSATDANGCPVMATGSALVTVNPATAINAPPVSQTRVVGQSVTFSVAATGTNLSYQWRKGGQPIPNATQSNFTINSVVLADQGSYDVVVTGTCGVLTSAPTTLTVTCPTITLGGLPQAMAGTSFNATLQASPAGGNYQFSSSNLPAWLTLAANGNLSGTPPATATFNFTVSVTGFVACQQSIPVSVTVVCPTVTLTPASLPNAEGGTPFNQQLTASPAGGNYNFSLASGLLPPGINLSPAGLLSGTTTQTGVFNFRVSVAGFAGQCTTFRDYVLLVSGCAPVTVTPASLSNGTVGAAYSQTVSAAGVYNFSVTSGALPPGLMLNAANGSLTGTPTTAGSFNFRIAATAGSCSGARDYTVTINCAGLTLGALANGTAGNSYNQSISVSPAGSYSFSLQSGNLPSGLSLNPTTGVISGLPTVAGTYNFTVKAQTANGCAATQSYALQITCPAVTLSALATPTLNSSFNQTVTASPSGGSYSFAITAGVLPAGLSLNPATGAINGTPTTAGAYNFTITATGFGACTGSRAYTGTISGSSCPTITLADLPGGQPSQIYSNSVTASPSGTYSYAVTSGSLPPGLTLYGSFGLLYGYPTSAGTFSFTITATDANNCTGIKQYSLTIGGAALRSLVFGDFDGDGKADLSVWRGQSGDWMMVASGDGQLKHETWGSSAAPYFDVMTPGDYDGDGKMDLAVFRRSTGEWLIKGSRDGAVSSKVWGVATDIPVPGDYDGDGKTDLAVWRGAETNWYIQRSSDGQTEIVSWGTSNAPYRDLAVPADYDGDGKTDIAVFRQTSGKDGGYWYIRQSSDGQTITKHWGLGTDVPVAADYDGDGKADIAVWRSSDTNWYIARSSDGQTQTISWGASSLSDVPVPGDYDGDGKADVAVWRASTGQWHVQQSRENQTRTLLQGQRGDQPVTARLLP
ncbi:MAG: putative Ig domain-containing protein, partial [Acidobacteriota bacterium]